MVPRLGGVDCVVLTVWYGAGAESEGVKARVRAGSRSNAFLVIF